MTALISFFAKWDFEPVFILPPNVECSASTFFRFPTFSCFIWQEARLKCLKHKKREAKKEEEANKNVIQMMTWPFLFDFFLNFYSLFALKVNSKKFALNQPSSFSFFLLSIASILKCFEQPFFLEPPRTPNRQFSLFSFCCLSDVWFLLMTRRPSLSPVNKMMIDSPILTLVANKETKKKHSFYYYFCSHAFFLLRSRFFFLACIIIFPSFGFSNSIFYLATHHASVWPLLWAAQWENGLVSFFSFFVRVVAASLHERKEEEEKSWKQQQSLLAS